MLLFDLYSRYQMGLLWYTDSRIEPSSAVHWTDTPHKAPFHQAWFYRGSTQFQKNIFMGHFFVCFLFTIGFKTNITSILLWFMTTSMHGRSDFLNGGEDKFARYLLLWSIFLPLSEYFSIDRWFNPKKPRTLSTSSLGVIGLTLQTIFLYSGGVFCRWRSDPAWFAAGNYSALYYSLTAGSSSTPFGEWFAFMFGPSSQYYDLCSIATLITTPLELVTPLLCCLIPYPYQKWRLFPIMVLSAFHIGILPALWIPFFQGGCLVALVAFLPIFYTPASDEPPTEESTQQAPQKSLLHKLRDVICFLLLCYMIMHFASKDLNLFSSPDDGNIGQAIRFYQGWQQYCLSQTENFYPVIIGTALSNKQKIKLDILDAIKTGNWENNTHLPDPNIKPHDIAAQFPYWRYERFIIRVVYRTGHDVICPQMLKSFCSMWPKGNLTNRKIEMNLMRYFTQNPTSVTSFSQVWSEPTVWGSWSVKC